MYSSVSKVGFAPARAYLGWGAWEDTVTVPMGRPWKYIRTVLPRIVGTTRAGRAGVGIPRSRDSAHAMARLVLSKTLAVTRDETVSIQTWTDTLPWGAAFVDEAYRLGAHPLLLHRDDGAFWRSVEEAGPRALFRTSPAEWAILEKSDVQVDFPGPSDTERLFALYQKHGGEHMKHDERRRTIMRRNGVRYAWLFLGRVNARLARRFGLTAQSWRRELVDATLSDPDQMQRTGARIAETFRKGREVVITHANGTRVVLRLKGREPRLFGGIVGRSNPRERGTLAHPLAPSETPLPAGYVSVALDEEYADGSFVSNLGGELSAVSTKRCTGGRWTFTGGRLVRATFERGQDEFDGLYAHGGEGRDRPGMITVGLNSRIHQLPWMMDQGLGTISLGIGANYHLGGATMSRIYSSLQLSGATLAVDGQSLVRGGHLA